MCVCVCVCVSVCECVCERVSECVCVCERERERERGGARAREVKGEISSSVMRTYFTLSRQISVFSFNFGGLFSTSVFFSGFGV